MSHWRGTMGELHDVMQTFEQGMGHLAQVSQNVAIAANGRIRHHGLANLGATSMTTYMQGQTDNSIVEITPQANGNTVMKYGDGTIKIVNAQGQDVTSNFITTPETTSVMQSTAIAVDNTISPITTAISNAASSATTAVGNVLGTAADVTKSLLVIGAVVGVLYVAHKMDGKKS